MLVYRVLFLRVCILRMYVCMCLYVGQTQRRPPVPKGPCWFCLGSPEVDKHLVVSVGEQVRVHSCISKLTVQFKFFGALYFANFVRNNHECFDSLVNAYQYFMNHCPPVFYESMSTSILCIFKHKNPVLKLFVKTFFRLSILHLTKQIYINILVSAY